MLFWDQIYRIHTLGIMALAYVVLSLPYTVQYVTSAFTQISDSLAGQVFGGNPFYIFRRITLPLIMKGVATGWMMSFIIAFRELVTASLIAPPNTLVVSTYILREFEQGSVSVGISDPFPRRPYWCAALAAEHGLYRADHRRHTLEQRPFHLEAGLRLKELCPGGEGSYDGVHIRCGRSGHCIGSV